MDGWRNGSGATAQAGRGGFAALLSIANLDPRKSQENNGVFGLKENTFEGDVQTATLMPGDALYIPPNWLHQVEYDTRSGFGFNQFYVADSTKSLLHQEVLLCKYLKRRVEDAALGRGTVPSDIELVEMLHQLDALSQTRHGSAQTQSRRQREL